MSSNKAALKAAKAALDARDYAAAAAEARKVLESDPQHYHANVFLGLALERSGQDDAAEKVYQHAVQVKDDDPLAWQGLIGLYEKQANKKTDEYAHAARRVGRILMLADDVTRCQAVVDKYVEFAKRHGTKAQYKTALELLLPTSELYDYLEGRLPHPALTYPKIAEIVEAEEKQRINKLIGERRTRLGAKIGQVTNDARREVFAESPLEDIYHAIIDWATDDDIRRLYEEKLLQRSHDVLAVLPPPQKAPKCAQVQKMAEGMVIIKHPFHLAWKITLEWRDVGETREMDGAALVDYMELFPEDGLTKILEGWFESSLCPFPKPKARPAPQTEDQDDAQRESQQLTDEERLISMTEGLEQSARSILSQRLMAEYYLHLEEYATAVVTARKAKELIQVERHISGLQFQDNTDAVDITLATSLVHHQAPRYHGDARALFESILERKRQNTPSLIGLGLILEEEEDYQGAVGFLRQTLEQSPNLRIKAEAAWCMALAGNNAAGLAELQACSEELDAADPDKNFKSQLLYRIGMCLWNEDPSKNARKDRTKSYSYFIASLQANLNFAPAYTILGIYYSEYSKDRKRARKCFQKAFELSASEIEAAQRLARSFADHGEWDLVEVVAQRVIDSGKTRPPPGSKKKGISWPYAALGVCQINGLEFAKSIVSFQSALRSAPEDLHSWIGLGESYHGSGRYLSATKAFEQVQIIQANSGLCDAEAAWFSRYMLANVERELGQYDEAIESFTAVVSLRPDEYGVSIALLQTQVEAAWRHIELGLFGRASQNACMALDVAATLVAMHSTAFNLWKAIGDACSIFTWIEGWAADLIPEKVQNLLQSGAEASHYAILSDLDNISLGVISELAANSNSSETAVYSSILAHKRAISCCANDIHAQAVAWYNLGWIEYRANAFFSDGSVKAKGGASAFLKACVRCFKRAIELEAGNAEFWNALGVATTSLNPKVAQHAFVRSLFLNGNSAKTWTNLGVFYLLQNDTELASEALNRGQSIDPDYADAWLGQGVLALLTGDVREANNLFTHAFEIGDSTSVIGKRLFSSTTFDQLLTNTDAGHDLADLLQPLLALSQLRSQAPGDVVHGHLACLLMERIGSHGATADALEAICLDIEGEYEVSESEETLMRFAQAKADLARAQLAAENYEAASESAETSLDLSSDEPGNEAKRDARNKIRLSAHLTAGLAYNYCDESSKSIAMFRSALSESSSNPDAVCLLAQVLWAKGGEDERIVAREQLLDCIESHPEHAGTTMLLAVIAILDDDAETLEAVASDLHGLRARTDLQTKLKLQVARILSISAQLQGSEDGTTSQVLAEATTSTMMTPSQPQGWTQLAELGDESFPAQMALLTALTAVPPKGTLTAEDVSKAYAGTGCAADAQRAIILSPWTAVAWGALA